MCSKLFCCKSKDALLGLVWTCLLTAASFGSIKFLRTQDTEYFLKELKPTETIPVWIVGCLALLILPIAGILADVCLGRYTTLIGSTWIAWSGLILSGLVCILNQFSALPALVISLYIASMLLVITSLSNFFTNSIQFITDQLQGSSSDQISSFVHWYCGIIILEMVLLGHLRVNSEALLLTFAVLVSFFICFHYCFTYKWFVREPRSAQPYTTILGVVNFARKHKYPLRRSALTYWEEELPSRIDLAKTKYGGPYTNEQVEDVKTVLQLLKLLLPIFLVNTVTSYSVFSATFEHHLESLPPYSGIYVISGVRVLVAAIPVPCYELFIRPFFWKCMPRILTRIGIAIVVSLVGMTCYLLFDVSAHVTDKENIHVGLCMFLERNDSTLAVSGYLSMIPGTIVFVAYIVLYMSTVEFVIAQVPQSMKGVVIGFIHLLLFGSIMASYLLVLPFSYGYKLQHQSSSKISCGSVYYLTNLIVGTIGLLLFILVARKYKYRQRDEVINTHMFAEEYYSK